MKTYPSELEIQPLAKAPQCTVSVPGSKSITNRALVLAALASQKTACTLTGALQSEDTEVMIECLNRLGFRLDVDWDATRIIVHRNPTGRIIPAENADLFVENSGTTMRFLTAMVSLGSGRYRLDGIPRMRERPIGDLLVALKQVGIDAICDAGNDCPPVTIVSKGWPKVEALTVSIPSGTSSQFLSGLLMAAAFSGTYTWVYPTGALVSEPYVEMTELMLSAWHRSVIHFDNGEFEICLDGVVQGLDSYAIEPDASAASYFFAAAAITGGLVTVRGMKPDMLQGDVKFVDALEMMGCRIEVCDEGITVHGKPLRGIDIDMNAISDTVMTLAAVACFAEGSTTIRNVGHIRHKETDRIAAIANELRKLGAGVEEYPDGLRIVPGPLHGARIETYNDHRMAMSLALVGLRVPGVVILNPGCVAKTYPGFWHDFEALRV